MKRYELVVSGKLLKVAEITSQECAVFAGPDHAQAGTQLERCGPADAAAENVRRDFAPATTRGNAYLDSL